ncbi:MAG: hypothetical protein GY765_20235 [bacterium]|nr:hypothetical protein [bacterium]
MHLPKMGLLVVLLVAVSMVCMAVGFKPPEVKAGENGWQDYVDPPMLDKGTVKDLKPGQGSPEAAVVHFYASKVRGDEAYNDVLLPLEKRARKLTHTMEKSKDWKFLKFQLKGKKKLEGNRYWIKIYFELSIKGKTDGGEDEAQVRFIDGKWYVYTVPA